jgi:predicted lipoprotein with Yx(FWY)xxD motif
MSTRWALRGVLIAALAPVGMAACGGSDESGGTPPAAATAPASTPMQTATATAQPAAAGGPASLKVGQSRLGEILVDARGHSLYYFTQDKPRRALCTSEYLNCTTTWAPLMTTGRPHGDAGIKTRLLGSLHRTKPAGSQVTYDGHPLYRFIEDKQPADLKGQGLYSYWYVLSPSGRPITKK